MLKNWSQLSSYSTIFTYNGYFNIIWNVVIAHYSILITHYIADYSGTYGQCRKYNRLFYCKWYFQVSRNRILFLFIFTTRQFRVYMEILYQYFKFFIINMHFLKILLKTLNNIWKHGVTTYFLTLNFFVHAKIIN